jgi:hypothetical protein
VAQTTCYCIYGVCGTCDSSLFVDYVTESIQNHEMDVLQMIEHSPDQNLHAWQRYQHPGISDVFEIENMPTQEAAQEAVLFWRAYFSSIGEIIINGAHVCDSFTKEKRE